MKISIGIDEMYPWYYLCDPLERDNYEIEISEELYQKYKTIADGFEKFQHELHDLYKKQKINRR